MSDGLPQVDLKDFADLRMGETIIAADCTGDGLPVYSADTKDAPWNFSSKCRVTNRHGCIVIGARGSIGNPRLPPFDEFAATQTTIVVDPNRSEFDPKFLLYALRQVDFGVNTAQQAVPMLTIGDLRRVRVSKPSKPTQRRIATILTTLDEVIEATEKLVEKHQQIKAGLMHDLFTRGLWTRPELARGDHKGLPCEATAQEGQLRPTPEEAPGLYQDSPIGLVPKEWDVNELRNWLSYLSYGFTNPMPESEDGPYMVTAADVTGGGIQYETCRRTTRIAYERLLTEKSRPKVGDVLLTKDGTLGRIAVVERENVCINQSVAVLRPANLNHSKFLAEMLSSPKWQQKMIADAGGSTIKHIYITVIDKMLVGWPIHSSEADAIVAQIVSANLHLELEKLHLAKLRQQKQGLMHDLLTGRVRVDDQKKSNF